MSTSLAPLATASLSTPPKRTGAPDGQAWLARPFLLLIPILLLYAALIPASNWDLVDYLLPWYDEILASDGLSALTGTFSNYNPPYIYLLVAASALRDLVPPIVAVKLVSIAGTLFLGYAVWRLLSLFLGLERARPLTLLSLLLPTVVLNGPFWGQCDAIWCGAAILAVTAFIEDRPIPGLVWLGVATSVKVLAVFLAPLVLWLLVRRRIAPWMLVIPAAAYAVMILPAALAGRPIADLLTIYFRQADVYHQLSMNAPNVWALAEAFAMPYRSGVAIGFLAAVAAVLAIAAFAIRRLEPTPSSILAVALLSALALPYALPKMHDRYFFLADLLVFVMAAIAPSQRNRRTATLVVVGSLLAYTGFLFGGRPFAIWAGALMMGAALARHVRDLRAGAPADPTDHRPAVAGA